VAYYIYLDNMLLPVAPGKITLKIKNQNSTMNLINDGEINLLKKAGLTEITFEFELPSYSRPYSTYKNGFQKPKAYLDKLESLKVGQRPFQFIVTRQMPNGQRLFDTNMKMSLEDYSITEDAKNGFDLKIKISLKQYRPYATKTCIISLAKTVSVAAQRETSGAPTGGSHSVVRGDSLYAISKKFYGDGNKWRDIYNTNKSTIDKRNKGTGNAYHTIYPGQVFVIP